MKKQRILIAEDVYNVSVDIRHTLEEMGYTVLKFAATPEAVMKSIEEEQPDLVLMDTYLNGELSGIETATMVYDLYKVPVVFLVSEVPADYLRDMIASEAFGVVIKPFRAETLRLAIELAFNKHKGPGKTVQPYGDALFVRTDYRHQRIGLQQILFIEAMKDYVVIHLQHGTVTTHTTIKGIEELLPEADFVRIHRSYIVRIDKIHSVRYPDLVIEGKMKVLPVGGFYKKHLFSRLITLQ
ncbi:MAG TPA: response regulator transcription factor [Bacteroidales bacterium]|nr:response regulator transcription factor [Bacteroidales bacterium]HRZ48597.1 response regulator transcription factor [Bacteroidales bacterium]